MLIIEIILLIIFWKVYDRIFPPRDPIKEKLEMERKQAREFYDKYCCNDYSVKREIDKKMKIVDSEVHDITKELEEAIGQHPTQVMIMWALYAKRGMLPMSYQLYDDYSPLLRKHDRICWVYEELSPDEKKYGRLHFLQWLDRELESHGLDQRLCKAQNDNMISRMPIQKAWELGWNDVCFWPPVRFLARNN